MFNYRGNLEIKLILIAWALLQISGNFNCWGFSLKPVKKESTSDYEEKEDKSFKPSISNLAQAVEYEDTHGNHKSHETSNLLKKCAACPAGILCVPQIQCPAHVRMSDHEKPQVCDLAGGKFGFCCVTGQNHTGLQFAKARTPTIDVMPPHIVEQSLMKFNRLLMRSANNEPIAPGHPEFFHGLVFHSTPLEDLRNFHLTISALEQVITTQVLSEEEQIPFNDIITNNINVGFKETPLAESCQPPRYCSNHQAKYRSFDGSCNNPHPSRSNWGAAGQAMERLLPPAYEDGIWMPRTRGKNGSLLASAREISRVVMADADRPHPKYNLMLMQFGQFLAHDIMHSASIRLENGDLLQCCTPDNKALLPSEKRHFACYPIEVDAKDDFYSNFGIRCMNFARSSLAPNSECRAGYGKQLSKVTHFIDASQIYGSSLEASRELRAFKGGKLRMFDDFGRQLLPLTSEKSSCGSDAPGTVCFKAGDGRANQVISLLALHLLFAREHNRIADKLAQLKPHASDELLFQESRRIVIAELQHIVYNEYLPLVIGSMQMERFRLSTQHHGYSNDYNGEVNPAIMSEFSAAAFRMGHSSVGGYLHLQKDEILQLPDVMFNPSRMRKRTFYDDMLKTLFTQPMQKVDSAVTYGLSRYLFRGQNPFGLDLAAINIQRGRDHGLCSYNDYLEVMGNRKVQSFSQLPVEAAKKLSQVYQSPDDIDLWVGGLQEKVIDDGVVGNTFAEIIADQFSRFKRGDRYYYEYSKSVNPGAFSLDQLHEIRKVTLARIICDNADHLMLQEVPSMAFVRADFPGNQPLKCDSPNIAKVNLEAFRH